MFLICLCRLVSSLVAHIYIVFVFLKTHRPGWIRVAFHIIIYRSIEVYPFIPQFYKVTTLDPRPRSSTRSTQELCDYGPLLWSPSHGLWWYKPIQNYLIGDKFSLHMIVTVRLLNLKLFIDLCECYMSICVQCAFSVIVCFATWKWGKHKSCVST